MRALFEVFGDIIAFINTLARAQFRKKNLITFFICLSIVSISLFITYIISQTVTIKDKNTVNIVLTIILIINAIPLLYVAWVLLIIFAKILVFACIAFVYPLMWEKERSDRIREEEGISFKYLLYKLVGAGWLLIIAWLLPKNINNILDFFGW